MDDNPEYIIKHRKNQEGKTEYYVKWVGCDLLQSTWESEDILTQEWPLPLKIYKQELKSNQIPQTTTILDADKVFEYTASVQDWETAIDCITYVERSRLPGLLVYIKWKNGLKSIHHSSEVYNKCPQKILDYFEQYRKYKSIRDK